MDEDHQDNLLQVRANISAYDLELRELKSAIIYAEKKCEDIISKLKLCKNIEYASNIKENNNKTLALDLKAVKEKIAILEYEKNSTNYYEDHTHETYFFKFQEL
jgi:hypothetical protein